MTSESLDGYVLPLVIVQMVGVTSSHLLGRPTKHIGQFERRLDRFHGDFEIGA